MIIIKSEIVNTLRNSKQELNKFGVSRIGLFGSVIRDEADNNSDIDILLDFNSELETFENYMNSCTYLEELFKEFKLDIVTEKGLSPFIGPYILKEVEYV